MAYLPMAVWGLEVPPGDMALSARPDVPSAFRITMAAIDPSAEAEGDGPQRATLKILRLPVTADYDIDSDDEEFDADEMEAMLAEEEDDDIDDDDDDDDDEDEEVNGGPSDPTKSKKARKAAAVAQIKELLAEEGMDVDDVNGEDDDEDEDEDEDDDEDDDDLDDEDIDSDTEIEEFVICTLDTDKQYQQPLDLVIGDDERVWFKVSGSHSVFLTGNYIEPADAYDDDDDDDDDDEDEFDYDLEPDEEDELDELDNLSSRVVEVDEEEAPALLAGKADKGKKRAVEEEEEEDLDDLIAKDSAKLTKKQAKKLKKNDGTAAETNGAAKKVAFAKDIEQGPTPSAPSKPSVSIKVVSGVTLDDRKIGSGPVAKKGDRVGIRYIGKLKDGKVFDSNKSGKPFSFKIMGGKGAEVIKGMEIGVTGMAVGGERRVIIPPEHGYGSKKLPDIPANSQLTFDIKVLDINKGK